MPEDWSNNKESAARASCESDLTQQVDDMRALLGNVYTMIMPCLAETWTAIPVS